MLIASRIVFKRVTMLRRNRKNKVRLMLDSGAYSAWTKNTTIDLKEYMAFIRENEDYISTYFNLDVIPGSPDQPRTHAMVEEAAKLSYKNLKIMKRAGLKPIPVFHQGEGFHWLDRMLDDGEEYIALGGLGGQTEEESTKWLDRSWARLSDMDGKPLVKVHGLGVGSWPLLKRYPWHTCDATSWALTASYGAIFVPKYLNYPRNPTPDFTQAPIKLTVSKVDRKSGLPKDHYLRLGPMVKFCVHNFIEKHANLNVEDVELKYEARAKAIIFFMLKFQEAIGAVRFKRRAKEFFDT